MAKSLLLTTAVFLVAVAAIAGLALLTEPADEDPCAYPQSDISAAVLGESPGDQDALANRAILMRAACEKKKAEQDQ
jgi:hypothetical protein